MMHWSEAYVGMRYRDGEFDCADLARLVQRERFGREIRLPGTRDHAGLAGADRARAQAEQIAACQADYAVPVDVPMEGDAVLMRAGSQPSHIGIWCHIAGEGWILHAAARARQVVLSRPRDLHLQGLALAGYYRWI